MTPRASVETAMGGSGAHDDVFVYGTLMCDEVFEAVVGRKPTVACDEAVLRSSEWMRRACSGGRVYPALVPAPRDADAGDGPTRTRIHTTKGRVLTGLDERDFCILDAFEDEYEKVLVAVTCTKRCTAAAAVDEGGEEEETRVCLAYVYRHPEPWVKMDELWNYEAFLGEHLDAYLEDCAGFRAELELLAQTGGACEDDDDEVR